MLKKILVVFVLFFMFTALTGCSGVVSKVGDMNNALKAQGREYGNTYDAGVGESLATSFFEWTITDVMTAKEFKGLYAEDGHMLLVVNCKATNITDRWDYVDDDDNLGMYSTDYLVSWGENLDKWDIPFEEYTDGMYPEEDYIGIGESVEGLLVYQIPSYVNNVAIFYEEVYIDDFVGDIYRCNIDLSEL